MNKIFITGIPTAGKSYLAKKLADMVGGEVVSTDSMREEISKYPQYKEWVDFYSSKNEKEYYATTSPENQWNNLVAQSEALWPFILDRIHSYGDDKPIIFEGVNILPHLAKRDLAFGGVVLIGKSREDVFDRIKQDHRWGNTEELWSLESESFFEIERPRYRDSAIASGYDYFEIADEALDTCLKLLSK
jgi:2-phosphoglycerate kinase